jgi:hypothetical protein
MNLKTAATLHSTASAPPDIDAHHLDQVAPTMAEAEKWDLQRKVVHIKDFRISDCTMVLLAPSDLRHFSNCSRVSGRN